MKYIFKILAPILFTIKGFAQVPQTYSVTIAPGSGTTHDVKGGLKVSGVTESSSVKVAGLATGNPYSAQPIYANDQGFLVTGYKVGYLSVPSAAFRKNFDVNSNGEYSAIGSDLFFYDGFQLLSFTPSNNRELFAPLYFPHKSKLSSIKILFSVSGSPRALIGDLIQASLNDYTGSSIFNFTTPTSENNSAISVEFPINLLEIDNQNFTYTLKLRCSTGDWTLLSIRGVSIEYRDF